MNVIKTVLKIVAGLIIGMSTGLLIAGIGISLFTDMSFTGFLTRLKSTELSDGFISMAFGIASLMISVPLLITIHEAGHLVCGLISGYRFVSFRIMNLTFIRIDGKIRLKRFSVAGTGGQCLLTPPDLPIAQIPVILYNAGGVLANMVILAITLPVLWLTDSPLALEFAVIFILTDLALILMNGIPLQANGIGNDAYNMLLLRRNQDSKRAMMIQLRSNALIQEGIRPKDMPAEWFESSGHVDYANALEVALPLMKASRLIDMKLWHEAHSLLDMLYSHRNCIMPLYVKEIACELAFTSLLTGHISQARELLDSNLEKYIQAYGKVMSSKERILCAISLYINHDYSKALSIYDTLVKKQNRYLLQGEVKSDIDLMHHMLQAAQSSK